MSKMMHIRSIFRAVCMLAVITGGASCESELDEYRNDTPVNEVSLNSYEFLKQQGASFDTLLQLIDRTGLKQALENEKVTFFAPQDYSIRTAMENLNFERDRKGLPPLNMDEVPVPVWDTILHRYVMAGIVDSDSLSYADGIALRTAYGYEMNGKKVTSNASGIVDSGPVIIEFSDKNNSRFIRDWSTSSTQTSDLQTANGMVHILENNHILGFNSFVKMAFPPKQEPFYGAPMSIPGIIESEDFDFGGEGLAYHDVDASNNGNRYRREGVDMETAGEGGYNIGWVSGGEWVEYTVNVEKAGNYKLEARIASPSTNGKLHVEFDREDKTGILSVPNTGGYQNWASISAVVELDAGVQIMRFHVDNSGFNISKIILTPDPEDNKITIKE